MSANKKIIGYAIDKNTVELTADGLSILLEAYIENWGKDAFEEMMHKAGWYKVNEGSA